MRYCTLFMIAPKRQHHKRQGDETDYERFHCQEWDEERKDCERCEPPPS